MRVLVSGVSWHWNGNVWLVHSEFAQHGHMLGRVRRNEECRGFKCKIRQHLIVHLKVADDGWPAFPLPTTSLTSLKPWSSGDRPAPRSILSFIFFSTEINSGSLQASTVYVGLAFCSPPLPLTLYLMRGKLTFYLRICTQCEYNGVSMVVISFFLFLNFFFFYQSRYCDVTTTTAHRSVTKQNALTPTRIQLKHSLCSRLFQHVVSGWKATQNEIILPSQDRLQQWTPWPWVAEILRWNN